MPSRPSRRAFTLIELAAVLVVSAVGGSMTILSLGDPTQPGAGAQPGGDAKPNTDPADALKNSRAAAMLEKDQAQVRGITTSLIVWAGQNNGSYPLPSKLDAADKTIFAGADTKDTTANIFSILIYSQCISPEVCISPAEANPSIVVDKDYMWDSPKTAKVPADALWDPAFAADFTAGKKGNVSYAHQQPTGKRLGHWQDTYSTTVAAIGNRAPEVKTCKITAPEKDDNKWTVDFKMAEASNTFKIHGKATTWEGNVGYNDGHVSLLEAVVPPPPQAGVSMYVNSEGKQIPDCLFFDEPDANEASNQYLGIFTVSAKDAKNWKGIWD